MADIRFFANSCSLSLTDAATLTGAVLTTASGDAPDAQQLLHDVAPLETAGSGDIGFLDNVKYIAAFSASKAGACFVRRQYAPRAPAGMALLITDEPHYAYALVARHFYPEAGFEAVISPAAHIEAGARIGRGCRIDAGAQIAATAHIGDECWIGANTIISAGVEIGARSRIGALCSLSHTIIGQRAILHRGVHIGTDGFGFASGKAGLIKVPQLGRVLIGNDVEIGSGTCIDRGAGPDTIIGDFSKIDNLVQIGHNVQLGRYVLIAGQAGIAGSTIVGDGVMMGGQVGIGGHVAIGARAKLAAQTGVMSDIPAGATYGGSPAVPIRDWHRQTVAVQGLTKRKETTNE